MTRLPATVAQIILLLALQHAVWCEVSAVETPNLSVRQETSIPSTVHPACREEFQNLRDTEEMQGNVVLLLQRHQRRYSHALREEQRSERNFEEATDEYVAATRVLSRLNASLKSIRQQQRLPGVSGQRLRQLERLNRDVSSQLRRARENMILAAKGLEDSRRELSRARRVVQQLEERGQLLEQAVDESRAIAFSARNEYTRCEENV